VSKGSEHASEIYLLLVPKIQSLDHLERDIVFDIGITNGPRRDSILNLLSHQLLISVAYSEDGI
jgi:hypothetical protein